MKSISLSTGSVDGRMGMGQPRELGTKDSQSRMAKMPSTSLATLRCVTPVGEDQVKDFLAFKQKRGLSQLLWCNTS